MPSLHYIVLVVIFTLLASEVLCEQARFPKRSGTAYHFRGVYKIKKKSENESRILDKLCPYNTEMTDILRKNFTDTHNYRRSQLALGRVPNFDEENLREASNMIKLEWDCTLETQAIDYVRTCPDRESDENARPKRAGELYERVNDSTVSAGDFKAAARMAVQSWWSIARKVPVKDCIGKEAKFLKDFEKKPIKSFTQMAWAKTTILGCAIGRCKFKGEEQYVVVCRYLPKGNLVDHQVYIPGPACSKCPNGYRCTTPFDCDQQNCQGLCVRRY